MKQDPFCINGSWVEYNTTATSFMRWGEVEELNVAATPCKQASRDTV